MTNASVLLISRTSAGFVNKKLVISYYIVITYYDAIANSIELSKLTALKEKRKAPRHVPQTTLLFIDQRSFNHMLS
jgi:hypothetical protein